MTLLIPPSLSRVGVLAGTAALCLGLSGPLSAQSVGADASIVVLVSHYVYRGETIDDLDQLERSVMPRTPRSVALDACGAAAARSLLAAAQRFRNLEIHLRVLDENAPACTAKTHAHVASLQMDGKLLPQHIDDAVVRTWWNECQP